MVTWKYNSTIPKLAARWDVIFTLRFPTPIKWDRGWQMNRSGRRVEEKILLPLPGIESKFVDYPTFSIVTKRA